MALKLSVFLQAQPELARTFLADPVLQDIGLFARFLLTEPESRIGHRRFRELTDQHQMAIATYGAKMLQLLRRDLTYSDQHDGLDPEPLHLSSEARMRWIEWTNSVEERLQPDGDYRPISGFANKLGEHALRIAGVLAVFENPEIEDLSVVHLRCGIELAEFYASEAIRLQQAAKISSELRHAQSLLDWLNFRWSEPCFTIRIIQQFGPNHLRHDKKGIERLIKVLEEHHWVKFVQNPFIEGRRTKQAWQIRRRASLSHST